MKALTEFTYKTIYSLEDDLFYRDAVGQSINVSYFDREMSYNCFQDFLNQNKSAFSQDMGTSL